MSATPSVSADGRIRPRCRLAWLVVGATVTLGAAAAATLGPRRLPWGAAGTGDMSPFAALARDERPAGPTVGTRFLVPDGFERVPVDDRGFAAYLRALPLRPAGTGIRLFDGRVKSDQRGCAAVLDLDLGPRDLQQCADSVIRLRAEHLFAAGRADEISFHFTSGFECPLSRWNLGERVEVSGSRVSWVADETPRASLDARESLRRYLDVVYTYAGTRSLPLDLVRAGSRPVEGGDVFLRPGSPGHAMIVVDVAARGSQRAFLLAQGFMPAQDVHVVRNPASRAGAAWYLADDGDALVTPEWRCSWGDRWRFP